MVGVDNFRLSLMEGVMQYLLSSTILAVLAVLFWVYPNHANWLLPPPGWIGICILGSVGGILLFLRHQRHVDN